MMGKKETIFIICCIVVGALCFFIGQEVPIVKNTSSDTINQTKITELQNEIIKQNQTITNLVNFMNQQQIPFDVKIINYTHMPYP
jgi:Tfp pilus assembly protein PilN